MRILILSVLALIATSCSSTPTPETPREVLATAEITFVGVVNYAVAMHQTGVIDDEQLLSIGETLQDVNDIINEASLIITSPADEGEERVSKAVEALRLSIVVMNEIAYHLKERQEKGPQL